MPDYNFPYQKVLWSHFVSQREECVINRGQLQREAWEQMLHLVCDIWKMAGTHPGQPGGDDKGLEQKKLPSP